MAVVAKRLMNATLLTNAAATYYTCPTATNTIIKKLTLNNIDTSTRTVTLYIIQSAGSASTTNALATKTLIAGQTIILDEIQNHTLNAGDFIQAVCSATSAVNMQMSGVEVT